jgi:hypothetical protein
MDELCTVQRIIFLEILLSNFFRFHCPKCSNQWASAKAMVVFYYPNKGERIGLVQMRFFGQQCRQCSRKSDYYVDPEFEDDSIQIILKKLYEKIGWDCYGKARPAKSNIHKDRPNQIQGPHEKNLCEACHLGYCDRN